MSSNAQRRLVVEIDDSVHDKLNKLLPWGMKQDFFRVVIDEVIDNLEKDQNSLLFSAIINRKLSITFTPKK